VKATMLSRLVKQVRRSPNRMAEELDIECNNTQIQLERYYTYIHIGTDTYNDKKYTWPYTMYITCMTRRFSHYGFFVRWSCISLARLNDGIRRQSVSYGLIRTKFEKIKSELFWCTNVLL
jgi:hypothetical protein